MKTNYSHTRRAIASCLRIAAFIWVLAGCQPTSQVQLIDKAAFEDTIDGKPVSLYTLKNQNGVTIQVTNFGARVVTLWVPDRNGVFADVNLGYDRLDKYRNNAGERFLGSTIGRYGNRLAKGQFTIDGTTYQVEPFNNGQALHGGLKGFDMQVWNVIAATDSKIDFTYRSQDGEEGFPGNLDVRMSYELTPSNEFKITYQATTDKTTPINLTNHWFANLKGEGEGDINDHILTINANAITPVDSVLIPTGELMAVDGTPFDFRQPTAIGLRVDADHPQLKIGSGYDHNFVLNRTTQDGIELAATVYEPQSGRFMEVFTTEPAIQFYGGNFFTGDGIGKSGKPYGFRCSIALETQHYPDSPNQPNFPSTLLNPGETYNHTCIYKFSIK